MAYNDGWSGELGYRLVDLKPGEIHVAFEPTFITTLLGSCVSVCLYSTEDMVGAMSHSVLPGSLHFGNVPDDVRYVENAVDRMLNELKGMGVRTEGVRAKVFGGAEMFRTSDREVRLARIVGDGNTRAAKECLRSRGINIVSECVGGNAGRKLVFNTVTGVVFVRKIGAIHLDSAYGALDEDVA